MEADNFLSKLRNAKTDKKMMTIYLDKNLAKKLKVIAAEQDKTMSEIVEEALKDKLQIKWLFISVIYLKSIGHLFKKYRSSI